MDEKTLKQLRLYKTWAITATMTTIVLGFFAITNSGSESTLSVTTPGNFTGRNPSITGERMGRGFVAPTDLLDNNGNVDIAAIIDLQHNFGGEFPSFFIDRFEITLNDAVANGDITSAQALAILNALQQ